MMKQLGWIMAAVLIFAIPGQAEVKLSKDQKRDAIAQYSARVEANAAARVNLQTGRYLDTYRLIDSIRRQDSIYADSERFRLRALAGIAMTSRVDKLMRQGLDAYSASDFEKGKDYFEQIIQLDPDNEDAHKHRDLCDLAIRVQKGQSVEPSSYRKVEIRMHGFTVVVTDIEQQQVAPVQAALASLEHVKAAKFLDLCGDVAIFRLLATPMLTSEEIVEALKGISEPSLILDKPDGKFIAAGVEYPRWLKGIE